VYVRGGVCDRGVVTVARVVSWTDRCGRITSADGRIVGIVEHLGAVVEGGVVLTGCVNRGVALVISVVS